MDAWRSLPANDQLTYLVGLIVRSAVELDAMTRTVWPAIMELPMHSAWEAPIQVSSRVDRLRRALPSVKALTQQDIEDAAEALETARSTYERRNRFIHDELMPEEDSDVDSWSAARMDRKDGNVSPLRERVDLKDAWKCERDLVRVTWRLWGLHQLVTGVQAGRAENEENRWRVMMRGRFDLHDHDNSISYSH